MTYELLLSYKQVRTVYIKKLKVNEKKLYPVHVTWKAGNLST